MDRVNFVKVTTQISSVSDLSRCQIDDVRSISVEVSKLVQCLLLDLFKVVNSLIGCDSNNSDFRDVD
jgi:hypothetical protein